MSDLPKWLNEFQAGMALLHNGTPDQCLAAMERLLATYAEEPLCKAMALDGMGHAYLALQRPDEAVDALQASIALLRDAKGPAAPMTLRAMHNCSNILLALGREEAAFAMSSEAVQLSSEAYGPESPQHAGALLPAAAMHYRQGELDEAEALLRRAQSVWEKQAVPVSELGTCLNNLGRIYEERGQLEEGIALHRQAVALRRELLGEHHDTAFSLGNLGVALATAEYWQEAATTLREAVTVYQRLGLGDSPDALGYSNNLGVCLQALARDTAPSMSEDKD